MKKLNKFFKKSAVITLSCTSLLQFTSVFAEGPENSNVGKSPSSVFEASNPLYYEVIPDAVADGPNSHKPPRPTHSQKKEQTLTPKKPTKESHTEEGVRIGVYEFPAGIRDITNFDVFKDVRPTKCCNHHNKPATYKTICVDRHAVKYQNNCGCTNRSVAYQDLGGVLGWKLARAAVLAGYQVPPSQRSRDGWDIYANPAAESELEKNLISDGLWIEKMRLDALPKDLKYADGKEFTEIDKQILCEIKQKKYL